MKQVDASGEPLILMVEDRDDDVVLIKRAFQRANVTTAMQVVRDGEEAIAYLSGLGKYSNRAEYPLPWLTLLDLKMPGIDGFEVLEWVRNRSGLDSLVVVVLTSSDETRDVEDAYRLGANSFMVKPPDLDRATDFAGMIDQYWLQRNRFPEAARRSAQEIDGEEESHGH